MKIVYGDPSTRNYGELGDDGLRAEFASSGAGEVRIVVGGAPVIAGAFTPSRRVVAADIIKYERPAREEGRPAGTLRARWVFVPDAQ